MRARTLIMGGLVALALSGCAGHIHAASPLVCNLGLVEQLLCLEGGRP